MSELNVRADSVRAGDIIRDDNDLDRLNRMVEWVDVDESKVKIIFTNGGWMRRAPAATVTLIKSAD